MSLNLFRAHNQRRNEVIKSLFKVKVTGVSEIPASNPEAFEILECRDNALVILTDSKEKAELFAQQYTGKKYEVFHFDKLILVGNAGTFKQEVI